MNILRYTMDSESHLQYRGYKPDKFDHMHLEILSYLPVSMITYGYLF